MRKGRRDILAARGPIKFHGRGVEPRSSLLATENWTESRQRIESPSGSEKQIGSIGGQLRPRFNLRFYRSAAGGYLEVSPYDLHCDGPTKTIRFFTPGPNIVGHRDHPRFDPNGTDQILREGRFRPRRLSFSVGLNRTIVSTTRDLKVPMAGFADQARGNSRVWRRKSAPVSMPSACSLAAVFGPTP